MFTDVRGVLRGIRSRKFTVGSVIFAAALMSAVAIALFTVADVLIIRPLPFEDPDTIIHLQAPARVIRAQPREARAALETVSQSPTLFSHRADVRLGTVFDPGSVALSEWGLRPAFVTPSFFDLFGNPEIGRPLRVEDTEPGPARGMVISRALWKRLFGERLDQLQSPIEIPGTRPDRLGTQWRIVGVMPIGFEFPAGTNAWIPYDGRFYEEVPGLPTYARLRPGISIDQVARLMPGVQVQALRDHVRPGGASAFGFLLGASLLLLLSSWLHVAVLLASQAARQSAAVWLRVALGGSRLQVVRPFLLEGAFLGGLSAVGGGLLAPALTAALVRRLPAEIALGHDFAFGARTIIFAAAILLVGAGVVSAVPGLLALRIRPGGSAPSLRRERSATTVGAFRTTVLAAQAATAVVLLYLAGMAWQSSSRLTQVDLGFQPEHLVAVRLPSGTVQFQDSEAARKLAMGRHNDLYSLALREIGSVPGVERAALAPRWPLERPGAELQLVRRVQAYDDPFETRVQHVWGDYLASLGGRLVEGRYFEPTDPQGTVVLINQTMAAHLSRYGPVLGCELAMTRNRRYRVVGVMADIVSERPDEDSTPEMLWNEPANVLLIRLGPTSSRKTGDDILAAIAGIWGIRAPRQLVFVQEEARLATLDYRARRVLLSGLALAGCPVLALGLWGTLGASLERRRVEIGIRCALGAGSSEVRRLLWRDTLRPISLGMAGGLMVGWILATLMRRYLFGIAPLDPIVVLATLLLVGLLTALAIEIAARRSQVQSPFTALRAE